MFNNKLYEEEDSICLEKKREYKIGILIPGWKYT